MADSLSPTAPASGTLPPAVRVFVDGRGVDAPRGATVLDAVRLADPALAGAVLDGTRAVTDSRGLPVAADAPVTGGSILRVVSARAAQPASDAAEDARG